MTVTRTRSAFRVLRSVFRVSCSAFRDQYKKVSFNKVKP